MKRKVAYIFFGLAILGISIVAFIFINQTPLKIKSELETVPVSNNKLKQCPDEWIVNQMPSTYPKNSESQYFILNGARRELVEFDVDWIEKNCNLKKQQVF